MDSKNFKKNFSIVQGKIIKKDVKRKKYRNSYKIIDDINFQSEKEANFYTQQKLKKKAGLIKDFKMQVRFDIVVNEIFIQYYLLDFLIEYNDGTKEYIDIKGFDKDTKKFITTALFDLKKKLVEAMYGIVIKII